MHPIAAPKPSRGRENAAVLCATVLLLAILGWRITLTAVGAPPEARFVFAKPFRAEAQGYLLLVGAPPPGRPRGPHQSASSAGSALPTHELAWPRRGSGLGVLLETLGYTRGPVALIIDGEGHLVRVESVHTDTPQPSGR